MNYQLLIIGLDKEILLLKINKRIEEKDKDKDREKEKDKERDKYKSRNKRNYN